MNDEEYSELLSLTRQNNQMLQEILAYVRKVDNPQFRDNENTQDFLMNLVANALVERLFENQQNFNNGFYPLGRDNALIVSVYYFCEKFYLKVCNY